MATPLAPRFALLLPFAFLACQAGPSARVATRPPEAALAAEWFARDVAQAARELIELTPPAQRALLQLPFDSDLRYLGRVTDKTPSFAAVLAWDLPGVGLQQGQLDGEQRQALHRLLSRALSPGGYQALLAVLNRQQIIGELEAVAESKTIRELTAKYPLEHRPTVFDFSGVDPQAPRLPALGGGMPPTDDASIQWTWDAPGPEKRRQQFDQYTLAIYGEPGTVEPWALRLEGHHITVNLTFLPDPETGVLRVQATPLFFGAFPMVVPDAPAGSDPVASNWAWKQGQSMMANAAHHLRQFWLALPAGLRAEALLPSSSFPQAPPLVMDTPLPFLLDSLGTQVDPKAMQGSPQIRVPADQLPEGARWHLRQAYQYFLGAMHPSAAGPYLARLETALSAGETVTLAWAGGDLSRLGSHHYTHVVAGDLLIEFLQSNQFVVQKDPQLSGNHVHSMLRDLRFDWSDPLRSHHAQDHQRHDH